MAQFSGSPPNIPAAFLTRVVQSARYVIAGITPETWMSPFQPLQPMAPEDVKGRQWDYPVGLNTRYVPRSTELVGFAKLRALAENCDILRTVIERQKDLIEAFEWQIKPREEAPGKRPGESKYKGEIEKITAFMRKPDRAFDWNQWLRAVLEDLFVIDAVTLYRRPTLDASGMWALERIDGATIVPYVDAGGRVPQSPSPAYAQILKGIPATDFTSEELIYYIRSPRNNRLYGQSPVQQIIRTVETAIERLKSQRAFFTEGNLVDGMFSGPKEWSIDQIKAWQSYWDDQFLGNVDARRHGIWVPNGTTFEAIKPPPLKDDFDEWLARIICFAFSTSPQPFIKQVSRGNQESQQQVAEDGGIASYMAFIKRLVDKVLAEDFNAPQLEFAWSTDKEFDPAVAGQIADLALRNGSKTLNEVRDANGDDPYPAEIGDVPMIVTATGAVTVESVIAPPEPAPSPAPGVEGPAPGGAGVHPSGADAPKAAQPAPKPKEPAKPLAKVETPAPGVDTPRMRKARAEVKKAAHGVLARLAKDVGEQVRRKALMMGKADDSDPDKEADAIAASLDLSGLDDMAEAVEDTLAEVAEAGGNLTMLQVGLEDDDKLTNQVAQRALTWARDRSAELVGKKWTADGELIDNPNAKWAIDDSTRTMLRNTIAKGLEDNLSVPALADRIKADYAFSEERAEVIAFNEVTRANVQGSLAGAREAQDAGVVLKKGWLGGQDPCLEICQPNIDQGFIDIDEDFESGDDGPPGHVGCYCSVSYEVDLDASKADGVRRFFCEAA